MVQRYERWHYRREGEVCGPLALGDVLRLIEEGEIDPETEICQDLDADEWIPAGRSELADRFGADETASGRANPQEADVSTILLWIASGLLASFFFLDYALTERVIPDDWAFPMFCVGPIAFVGLVKSLRSILVKGVRSLTGWNIDRPIRVRIWAALSWATIVFVYLMLPSGSAKPVIYLYPEREMDVRVQLEYDGRLDVTYPAYPEGGWRVTARPDGTLIDPDGREYSYLFWEGRYANAFDFSRGAIVRGEDTARFLQDALSAMGLIPREYNEFIVYWLPKMRGNAYNLIAFQGASYTDHARLTISPEPDSVLRVSMAFKPVPSPYAIPPQTFPKFERKGFTVIEWGGCDAGAKIPMPW